MVQQKKRAIKAVITGQREAGKKAAKPSAAMVVKLAASVG